MLKLRPNKLTLLLTLVAVSLLTANCAVLLAKSLGYDSAGGLVPLFDFGEIRSLPGFFSTLLAMLATGLLLVITLARKRVGRSCKLWGGLTALFLLLSMGGYLGVDELVSRPLRDFLDDRDLLYFAWIIPYGLLAMLLAGIYGRFVLEMPAPVRNGILLSATLMLIGGLGFELLGDWLAATRGGLNPPLRSALVTMQTSLHMAGMIFFIHALMRYIEDVQKNILLQLGSHDPLAHIISEAQKPLPPSVFRRFDNSNRAER